MYEIHTLNEYNAVMNLRRKFGWGSTKISSFLSNKGINIKRGAIDGWIYRDKEPFEEKIITKISKKSKILTEEKAYILGVLCGDGWISTGYRLGLDVCDFDFIEKFRKCLKFVYNLNLRITKRRKLTNFGKGRLQYCGMLVSKRVCLDLLRYASSFKSKKWTVPNEILESSNLKIKSAFLRGLFDSEGTICLKKKGHAYLQVCSGNNDSLLVIRKMLLEDFDIKMGIKYNNIGVMVLYTERYRYIKNFLDNVGFTIERKRKMLDFCLLSYKRKGLRSYDKAFRMKALKLLREGYSTRMIGKLLNFPYTNIYDFIKQEKNGLKDGRGIGE